MNTYIGTYIRTIVLRRDLLSLSHIDKESFDVPWSAADFAKKLVGAEATLVGIVAEYDGHVVGYAIYRLSQNDVSIRRLAVDQNFRRRGVGTSLVMAVVELNRLRRESMSVIVDEYDLQSQLFLRKCGFKWDATLYGKFMGTDRDKYRMVRTVGKESRPSGPQIGESKPSDLSNRWLAT